MCTKLFHERANHLNFLFFFSKQLTGTVVAAAKRLQFAFEMKPIPQIEIMKNLPEVIFPLFWVEEGVQLSRTFTNPLKYGLYM